MVVGSRATLRVQDGIWLCSNGTSSGQRRGTKCCRLCRLKSLEAPVRRLPYLPHNPYKKWAVACTERFMADINASLYITERKRKSNVHHYCKSNDFRAGFEVAEWRMFFHSAWLQISPARFKQVYSDKALTVPKWGLTAKPSSLSNNTINIDICL